MKVGEWVRVIGVPPNLTDDKDMKTRTLFENCLGRAFRIEAIENVGGFPYPLIELHVGHILGKQRYAGAIWVEPEYLEPAEPERHEVR